MIIKSSKSKNIARTKDSLKPFIYCFYCLRRLTFQRRKVSKSRHSPWWLCTAQIPSEDEQNTIAYEVKRMTDANSQWNRAMCVMPLAVKFCVTGLSFYFEIYIIHNDDQSKYVSPAAKSVLATVASNSTPLPGLSDTAIQPFLINSSPPHKSAHHGISRP